MHGIDQIKDTSEAVYTLGDLEGTLQIEYDYKTLKMELTLFRFSGTFGTLRFDDKSAFYNLLGFTSFWQHISIFPIHADSPGVYTSEKFLYLSTKDKICSKCDFIDGRLVNGSRQLKLEIFGLDESPG